MNKTSKKECVLVTGAGGFLGFYITLELLKNGYSVRSLSRNPYKKLDELGVTQYQGDISHYPDVENALLGVDAVIHTASKIGMWGLYSEFFQTNVLGTQNILKAMKNLNILRIVYTSTPSVVYGTHELLNIDESTPYPEKYLNSYGQTKAMAEKEVLKAIDFGIMSVSLRPHLIFGPGDQNLIPRVLLAQKKGRLKIIGTGDNLVDVSYVENVAELHVLALKKLYAGSNIVGKAYFIGQGPIKLWEFTNEILKRNHLPIVSKKIPLKIAYIIGAVIEFFLKLFKIYNIDPPMTRFVAMQLGTSHFFNHHNLHTDFEYEMTYSIEEGLNKTFSQSIDQQQ